MPRLIQYLGHGLVGTEFKTIKNEISLPRLVSIIDHRFPRWQPVAGDIRFSGFHSSTMFCSISANHFDLDQRAFRAGCDSLPCGSADFDRIYAIRHNRLPI